MLKARVATALVLIPLVLWLVWFAPLAGVPLALAAVVALSAWEWSRLAGLRCAAARWLYAIVCTALTFVLWALFAVGLSPAWLLAAALAWWLVPAVRLAAFLRTGGATPANALFDAIAGAATLAAASIAVLAVHLQAEAGPLWLTFLLVLVWGADVGGYFAGRRWGRRRLAPAISPGKTWAGVWGGIVLGLACVVGVYAIVWFAGDRMALPGALPLAAGGVAAIAMSVLGDLFESMIKRQRGLKDSGGLLPGHGGLLDRVDGLLAAAPVMALLAFVLGGGHA